jgi:myo-inositol-1(or 4)-monophosphatase
MTSAESLLPAALEIALDAGRIHLGHWRTIDPGGVRLKGRRDPVTEADLAAEQLIVDAIARRFPGHRVVAEEGGERPGDAEFTWYVDPLDGTVNFAHGLPVFAVSIAVCRGTDILAGVVHAPALRETFEASRGGGARRNGRPIHVSATAGLREALLATGFAYKRNDVADNNVREFADLVLRCRDLRRLGSAAYDLACVAAGHYDAYWEPHLNAWDLAAGVLLVTEAGGRATDLAGGTEILARGDVLASNGTALHEELLARVRRVRRAIPE